MTKEKEKTQNGSNFKFVLYQGKNTVVEKIFSADALNPIVRYSVDIRDTIPDIIQRLQKVMSRRNLTYTDNGYNYLEYYEELAKFYHIDDNKLSKPEYVKYSYGNKIIKGVECKFGLYINNNPIVERKFYVDNYNVACRFSTEIVDVVNEITNEINQSLKELDIEHMWGDYILTNSYGLYPNQIRDLSNSRRKDLIDNFGDPNYIKKVRSSLRNSQSKNHKS